MDRELSGMSFLVQIDPVYGESVNTRNPKVFSIDQLEADQRNTECQKRILQKGFLVLFSRDWKVS